MDDAPHVLDDLPLQHFFVIREINMLRFLQQKECTWTPSNVQHRVLFSENGRYGFDYAHGLLGWYW
jgi:hypothetical protein